MSIQLSNQQQENERRNEMNEFIKFDLGAIEKLAMCREVAFGRERHFYTAQQKQDFAEMKKKFNEDPKFRSFIKHLTMGEKYGSRSFTLFNR